MIKTVNMAAEVNITIRDGVDWLWWDDNGEKKWRGDMYGLQDEDEVLEHFAYNAVSNGVQDGNKLDGWADLEWNDIYFQVTAWAE